MTLVQFLHEEQALREEFIETARGIASTLPEDMTAMEAVGAFCRWATGAPPRGHDGPLLDLLGKKRGHDQWGGAPPPAGAPLEPG